MASPSRQPSHVGQPRWLPGVRRRLVSALMLGGVLGGVLSTGCGFALRQTPSLPFRRLQITGAGDDAPVTSALRTRLRLQGVQLQPTPDQAEAVLQVLQDRRSKRVVASTAVGQVRELELKLVFDFRLSTPAGRELIASTELQLTRDMSYSETAALGKAQEEAELFAAMQADIVAQVLRRLASVPMG